MKIIAKLSLAPPSEQLVSLLLNPEPYNPKSTQQSAKDILALNTTFPSKC